MDNYMGHPFECSPLVGDPSWWSGVYGGAWSDGRDGASGSFQPEMSAPGNVFYGVGAENQTASPLAMGMSKDHLLPSAHYGHLHQTLQTQAAYLRTCGLQPRELPQDPTIFPGHTANFGNSSFQHHGGFSIHTTPPPRARAVYTMRGDGTVVYDLLDLPTATTAFCSHGEASNDIWANAVGSGTVMASAAPKQIALNPTFGQAQQCAIMVSSSGDGNEGGGKPVSSESIHQPHVDHMVETVTIPKSEYDSMRADVQNLMLESNMLRQFALDIFCAVSPESVDLLSRKYELVWSHPMVKMLVERAVSRYASNVAPDDLTMTGQGVTNEAKRTVGVLKGDGEGGHVSDSQPNPVEYLHPECVGGKNAYKNE